MIKVLHESKMGWLIYGHDIRVGRDARVLLRFGDTFRSLLFLNCRPDGSVVVGPGKKGDRLTRTARRIGTNAPLPSKIVSALGETAVPPNLHLTFHQSGVISSPDGARTYRAPLDTEGVQRLCRFKFEHPGYLPPVNPRSRDIVLPWVITDLGRASVADLAVVPLHTAVMFHDIRDQAVVLLHITRPSGVVVRAIQFTMWKRDLPWPSATTIEWASQDPSKHGFQG